MRLPMNGDDVDIAQTNIMVDEFINAGFNYFDTAYGYIQGKRGSRENVSCRPLSA